MSLLQRQVRRRSRPRPRRERVSAAVEAPSIIRPNLITEIVSAQDRIPEPGRVPDGHIHLTSLIDACARQLVILRETETIPTSPVTGAHRVMWKMGRAAEQHVRDSYIQAVNYEGVYGGWECMCKRTKYTGFFDHRASKCKHCGYQPTKYFEMSMIDPETKIVGNPDLVIFVDGKFLIIELKSMNKDDFDALEQPVPNHCIQGGGYRRLYDLNDLPVHDHGVIIYVKKDFVWRGSPYKEKHVDLTSRAVTGSLDIMWDMASQITNGTLDNLPPKVSACTSLTCTRAKNCPALMDCFQRG